MKHRLIGFILVIILSLALVNSAGAQEYYFSVPQQTVNIYYNADGTMSLDYVWVFDNQPGAHAIEYVDVGMPYSTFDMSTVTADVGGTSVNVSQSDFQGDDYGFAVVLGSRAIQPGQRGTVHVYVGRITRALFTDSTDNNFASGEFIPSYFPSSSVAGTTRMMVSIHLPQGVQPEEPRWHPARGDWPGSADPQPTLDEEGRVTYTWTSDSAAVSTRYTFGASFPKSYVPADAISSPSLFETLGIDVGQLMDNIAGFAFFACFALIFFGSPIITVIADRKRKLQYLPPKISIEGHGIKRGLTAVEAAILMQEPLDKVMTMILFGVLKKGAAEVITRDPLKIQKTELPAPPPNADGSPAPKPELREYEKAFVSAMASADNTQRRRVLQDMTIQLIKSVSEKMKGFSRKETVDYYKSIMERAWNQIETAGTPEVKSQMASDAMEWTMLDRNYDDRARRVFTGPVYAPTWWDRYDPIYRGRMGAPAQTFSPSSSSGGRTALPGADFAASVVTGVQTFSSKVIGDLNTFTGNVTNKTNPPPAPARSGGSGRSGSGGCACACACAGCACACAGGSR